MKVCFIGHRKIDNIEEIKKRVLKVVSSLISQGADIFIFGSRSDFDYLCWNVVTELQNNFPSIKRIKYNAPHEEGFESKAEREHFERIYLEITHKTAHFMDYEKVVQSKKALHATKNTYIARNQEMLDESDVCIFYYNKSYQPPRKNQSKSNPSRSGTAIAYQYAKSNGKKIINVFIE